MAFRLMATAALLLLALCALAVEGQTKSHPVMFKDFMEAKSGKVKISSDSYGYEESELQGACLRGLTYQNCAETGGYAHQYFETDVGCCSEGYHKHQDTFRLPEDLKVGKCWWTIDRIIPQRPDDITPGVGITLEGTYEMTCEMEKDSEKCGEPLCEDLVLKGWGQVYLDPTAAILGQPTITADDSCEGGFFPERVSKNKKQLQKSPAQNPTQKPAEKLNPVKLASADYYYKEEQENEYFEGRVRIFTGYVQVMSCSKKVVYKEGKMQAIGNPDVYVDNDDKPIVIKPSANQFIAKPYTMDLILRKSGDY